MNKSLILLVIMAVVGCALGRPQGFPVLPAFPFGAAGIGQGGVQNGAVIGSGTGIANPGPGGIGIALGVGGAVASPVGNFAFASGQSSSSGRK